MRARQGGRGMRGALAALLGFVALAPGCGPQRQAPTLPEGTHLVANGTALRGILERLAGLQGTPLGRVAAELSVRLATCGTVSGSAPDGGLTALASSLECTLPDAVSPPLRALRGTDDLLLILRASERQRVVLTGRLGSDGSLALAARLDPPTAQGALGLLLPSEAPAGSPVLAIGDAVVHARVRPRDGIDLAALVPEGSQGDRLFRMRSVLFSRAVLAGVWELAVYMPVAGATFPPMAAALDVRSPEVATEAVREFLGELASAWPIHATPIRLPGVGAGEGGCLLDLHILPELAPCWVTTPRALVVAWNPPSLERALRGTRQGDADAPSRLAVWLDRIGEADRRLRAVRGSAAGEERHYAAGEERHYGWQRLEIHAAPGGALRIALADVPAEADGSP